MELFPAWATMFSCIVSFSSDFLCIFCYSFSFRDKLIDQLKMEIESLKFELERTKKEDQRIIEMLKKRLKEMEMEMNEHRNVVETQCQVSGHVTGQCQVIVMWQISVVW